MSRAHLVCTLAAHALGVLLAAGCGERTAPCVGTTPAANITAADGTWQQTPGPVPAAIAAGQLVDDATVGDSETSAGRAYPPFELTEQWLARGRQRFELSCAVCHGRVGDGVSLVANAGLTPAPASFHVDRLRREPVGHFFLVASRGTSHMPAFARSISAADRWAIAVYLRALQLSQDADVGLIPTKVRLDQGWER